ncbi:IclR family transcriptional regulator (plasmid) [Rhodococcus ruber]|nr:IclR family transcriptional regulator [Rhodococcus ruber]
MSQHARVSGSARLDGQAGDSPFEGAVGGPPRGHKVLALFVDDGFVLRRPDRSGFALGHKVAALTHTAIRPTG